MVVVDPARGVMYSHSGSETGSGHRAVDGANGWSRPSGTLPGVQPQLASLALRRGGVFTRADAIAAGYTPGEVRSRLDRGTWVRLRRGIYALTALPGEDRRLMAAALAALPASAALSHSSAAQLHGLPLIGPPPATVEVTVPGAAARTRRGLTVHGRGLPADQVGCVDGLRTTDHVRTALDLARSLPYPNAVAVVDAALRARPDSRDRLVGLADDGVGPRSARARRVVEFADGDAESAGESLSRVALASHGLPAPSLQAWVRDGAGPIGRVDFLWAAERTVGEFDGRMKYQRPDDLWAEKRREDGLRVLGFEVVRWVWTDVVGDFSPVARRIRAAFARAAR